MNVVINGRTFQVTLEMSPSCEDWSPVIDEPATEQHWAFDDWWDSEEAAYEAGFIQVLRLAHEAVPA